MFDPRRVDPESGVCLGLRITPDAGRSLVAWLDDLRGQQVAAIDVDIRLLEELLRAPQPAVPIEPPPVDGLAFGLLELEEEVLHDSYTLAAATHRSQVQQWRTQVDLAPLGALGRDWSSAGLPFGVVTVPDLARWSAEEQDYACRLTQAIGARIVATEFSAAGPQRLAPLVRRHDVCLSFVNDATTSVTELARVAAEDGPVAVALDLRVWTRRGQGPVLPFIEAHAGRISHVHLPEGAHIDQTAVLIEDDEATVADVIEALGRPASPAPAVVVTAGDRQFFTASSRTFFVSASSTTP